MWKWIVGVCCSSLVFASLSYAQCPGGVCPVRRPPVGIGDLPAVVRPASNYRPIQPIGHWQAAVQVICLLSQGEMAGGSGVYINYEGMPCVLTANHVLHGNSGIFVIFANNEYTRAELLVKDSIYDCAVLVLEGAPPDISPAKLAYGEAGDNLLHALVAHGGFGPFDSGRQLHGGSGYVVQYVTPNPAGDRQGSHSYWVGHPKQPNPPAPDWMVIASKSRKGDSGGPIFNKDGLVVGILWGGDNEGVIATSCGRLHILLTSAKQALERSNVHQTLPGNPKKIRPVLPWRKFIEDELEKQPNRPQYRPPAPQTRPKIKKKPPALPIIQTPQAKKPANGRYRVDQQLAVLIICSVVALGMVAGIAVQWKKTHSIK